MNSASPDSAILPLAHTAPLAQVVVTGCQATDFWVQGIEGEQDAFTCLPGGGPKGVFSYNFQRGSRLASL